MIYNDPDCHESIWVAVATYSHTDKRKLWKVLTRPTVKSSAEIYAEMFNDDELKKPLSKRKKAFIIKMVDYVYQ